MLPAVGTFVLELRCSDVHPHGCSEILCARSPSALVDLACEHGSRVHGFTPAWYSPSRLAVMAAVAARDER
jgi:hypothetical protein